MIKWIKKYPVSAKFILSLLIFGVLALVGDGGLVSLIAGIGFVADIFHFYKSGGAGDK